MAVRSLSRTRRGRHSQRPGCRPKLGLVCVTRSDECRFRTITRTRFLSFDGEQQRLELAHVYWDNIGRLHGALGFCHRRGIKLYRVTSGLFPMSDDAVGAAVLEGFAATLSSVGRRARRLGIRVLMHPDQFVVLNSESPEVADTSTTILGKHARALDLMGFPRSPWSALIIHGGKSGRGEAMVERIRQLPPTVRRRLVLENDEYAYGAAEILDVCRRARVPMVFDAHHHVIKENLDSYEHPSVGKMVAAARATWPRRDWQIVHLSNGAGAFADRNHSDLITSIPGSYAGVPWVEVEARGKELAIERLRVEWPCAD